MESYFDKLKRAITPFTAPAMKNTSTAMDGISERMADAAAASYIASVAEDAGFEETDHPREAKGGKGGGRFRTSGKTIEREDDLSESTGKAGGDWELPSGTSPQTQTAREMPFMSDKTKKALKDNGFFIEKDILNKHIFNLRHKDGFILGCSWTPTDSAKENDEGFAREMREVARVEKVEHVLPEKTRKALNALVDSLSKGA